MLINYSRAGGKQQKKRGKHNSGMCNRERTAELLEAALPFPTAAGSDV